jgi:DNA mismatch endonuclease (patch repair protein)
MSSPKSRPWSIRDEGHCVTMADAIAKARRSQVMAAVRSSGNKSTELKLIAIMNANGISGWRRRQKLPGKPDFVFRKARVIIFVDGCFWHGCRWHCRVPMENRGYWIKKIQRNKERDRTVNQLLRNTDWSVVRIWEHALSEPVAVIRRIESALKKKTPSP